MDTISLIKLWNLKWLVIEYWIDQENVKLEGNIK